MTHLYLNDHMRLKTYSASVKGARSLVRIDIEVSEPGALGWLLKDLADIEREQAAKAKAEKEAARKASKTSQLALPAPLLQIPHFPEGDDA